MWLEELYLGLGLCRYYNSASLLLSNNLYQFEALVTGQTSEWLIHDDRTSRSRQRQDQLDDMPFRSVRFLDSDALSLSTDSKGVKHLPHKAPMDGAKPDVVVKILHQCQIFEENVAVLTCVNWDAPSNLFL